MRLLYIPSLLLPVITLMLSCTSATDNTALTNTHDNDSIATHSPPAWILQGNVYEVNVRITLDVSHWVNVAESFLDDQPDAMELAIQRTEHIHARVGYPEGPQVSDPAAPEWNEALQHHLNWWDKIIERKRSETNSRVSINQFKCQNLL